MASIEEVRSVVATVLQLDERAESLHAETALLGNIPEFDSMAVVSVMAALEDWYGIEIEDDEVSAETFETLGSLVAFVNGKL